MSDEVDLLKRVYDRFNARDMETVLAAMHEPLVRTRKQRGRQRKSAAVISPAENCRCDRDV